MSWTRAGSARRWLLGALTVGVVAAGCGADTAPPSNALQSIGAGLSGPAGVRVSVYATGLADASGFAFDDQGRLFVATAAEKDTGTDGLYVVATAGATPVEVVHGLHTPLGLLWYQGSLYVASAAGVTVESGFDGSGFSSSRTIVTIPAGTGEVNGLALLPDGRIAMGISAPCDHCMPTATYSASVVTFLPDGSDLQVEASGIRAPVGLTVSPVDHQLLVTMNQRDDLGNETPGDWLAVVRPGQAWGFPDCYGQGGSACAGAPKPLAMLDTHAAVSGVTVVTGQLGPTTGTAALVAEWNTGKVVRVPLASDGSAADPVTFVTGIQHPEPLVLTPSGTVLVGDWGTGTIYELSAAASA